MDKTDSGELIPVLFALVMVAIVAGALAGSNDEGLRQAGTQLMYLFIVASVAWIGSLLWRSW